MQKISIIITSFNQKKLLHEAVESVIGQTYRPFEILICDDASTDGSQELIKNYEEKFPDLIRGILHKNNQGISNNRNSGLKAVKGDFVAWLDGDDMYLPEKLEMEISKLQSNPEARWVYSQVCTLNVDTGHTTDRYREFHRGNIFDKVLFMLGYAPRNPLVHYDSLQKVGFFDPRLGMYEDFDLITRLAKHFPCEYCKISLMEYRIHSLGIHNSGAARHIANMAIVLENIEKLLHDEPKHKIKKVRFYFSRIEKQLLIRQNTIEMQEAIKKGQRINALRKLADSITLDPQNLLKADTFKNLNKIFLIKNNSANG